MVRQRSLQKLLQKLLLLLIFALSFGWSGSGSLLCGINDQNFAEVSFRSCYIGEETGPLNLTDYSETINCDVARWLEVNCTETNITWIVYDGDMPNTFKWNFSGTCTNSSGHYAFGGFEPSFSLPHMYNNCIFSACFREFDPEGRNIYHFTNKTTCMNPSVTTESVTTELHVTKDPIHESEGMSETLSTTDRLPHYITIQTAIASFGVPLCLLTAIILIVICVMLYYRRRWKKHLKNLSIKHGKVVLDDSSIPTEAFEPVKIVRSIISKSQESVCHPLYKHLDMVQLEGVFLTSQDDFSTNMLKPKVSSNYYSEQAQTASSSINVSNKSSSIYFDEDKNSFQTYRSNSLDLQHPFERPYFAFSIGNDSGYMDTGSKEVSTLKNNNDSCEMNSQESSNDLFMDRNLEEKLSNTNIGLGYLPSDEVSVTTEARGYVMAETSATIPMTDSSDVWCGKEMNIYIDKGSSSSEGYLENMDKVHGNYRCEFNGSINLCKSTYIDESENIRPHHEMIWLDEDQQDSGGMLMTYFGDDEETSSGYIFDSTNHHYSNTYHHNDNHTN